MLKRKINTSKKITLNMLIMAVSAICLVNFPLFTKEVNSLQAPILFPLAGEGRYSNDFTASRADGQHDATDIFAEKGRPVLAAMSGTVVYVSYPQPSWGYMVGIRDAEGYRYNYIHLNNDTPGTDDGQGGGMNAYAPDIKVGNKVVRGQLVGYVGDSGNAETTPPHLHFEIIDPQGNPVNPYQYLLGSEKIYGPVPYPQLANENLPYGNFVGGLNITTGNMDSQTDTEIITAAGTNGGPHIKVYESDLSFSGKHFFAYDPAFTGGVDVATGDINGDGVDEIITGPGKSGGPNVRIFTATGQWIGSFMAYDPAFTGGIFVASGDVDGDGIDDIITAPSQGGGPNVKVFEASGRQKGSFFVYDPNFSGGVDVSAGDVTGDSKEEIITSAGVGGGPHIRTWAYTGDTTNGLTSVGDFFAYAPSFSGGVRISVADVNPGGKSEIVTVPYSNGGPQAKLFSASGQQLRQTMYLEEWWYGRQDVAAGDGFVLTANGLNRRATIRQAF